MTATRYQFSIDWLSGASPWWLLIIIPVVVLITLWLYRPQLLRLTPRSRWSLLGLRLFFVVAVAFLIFRPRLEVVQTETFGGTYAVITDTSATMNLPLKHTPPAVLKAIEKQFQETDEEISSSQNLLSLAWFLHGLAARQDEDFLSGSAYWEYLDDQREIVESRLQALEESLSGEDALFVERFRSQLAPQDSDENTLRAQLRELRSELREQLARVAAELEEAVESEQPESETRTETDTIAGMSRQELANRLVNEMIMPAVDRSFPGQNIELSESNSVPDSLRETFQKDTRHPLDGVIVLSDGITWEQADELENLLGAYAQAGVPIHAIAMGEAQEPPDLAVLQLDIPVVAVADQPLPFRYRVKSTFPDREGPLEISWTLDGQAIEPPEDPNPTTTSGRGWLEVSISPGQYPVTLSLPAQEGEITDANNALDVWMSVRESPFQVLLLESGGGSVWSGHFAHTLARIPWVALERRNLAQEEDVDFAEADLVVIMSGTQADADLASRAMDNAVNEKIPVALIGVLPDSLVPEGLKRTLPAPDSPDWHRTPEGRSAWPTRHWDAAASSSDASPQNDAEVWLEADHEPLWGWTSDSDGVPVVVLHLPPISATLPGLRDADFAEVWTQLVTWIEALSHPGVVLPLRIEQGDPVRLFTNGELANPRLIQGDHSLAPEGTARLVGERTLYTFLPEHAGLWQLVDDNQESPLAQVDVVFPSPQLANLARNDAFLRSLTARTGGYYTPAHQAEALLPWLESSQNTEIRRFHFSFWSSVWTLVLLLLLLLTEWIYRKRIGLL